MLRTDPTPRQPLSDIGASQLAAALRARQWPVRTVCLSFGCAEGLATVARAMEARAELFLEVDRIWLSLCFGCGRSTRNVAISAIVRVLAVASLSDSLRVIGVWGHQWGRSRFVLRSPAALAGEDGETAAGMSISDHWPLAAAAVEATVRAMVHARSLSKIEMWGFGLRAATEPGAAEVAAAVRRGVSVLRASEVPGVSVKLLD